MRSYIGEPDTEACNGTRKQEEIHIEAETEGIQNRKRLQEAWRQQQRSGAPRLGDCKQIR